MRPALRDLDQVIRLCESGKQKGLGEDSEKFCDQLLTGTLFEMAQQLSAPILKPAIPIRYLGPSSVAKPCCDSTEPWKSTTKCRACIC
ncbi:MAG: hypothetical protein R3B96_03980 [Pirellulaceae bacterium]